MGQGTNREIYRMSSWMCVMAQHRREIISGKNGEMSHVSNWHASIASCSSLRASQRTLRSSSTNSAPTASISAATCADKSILDEDVRAHSSVTDLRRKLAVWWLQCFISSWCHTQTERLSRYCQGTTVQNGQILILFPAMAVSIAVITLLQVSNNRFYLSPRKCQIFVICQSKHAFQAEGRGWPL